MNITPLVLVASILIIPATATGQTLTAVTSITDSASRAFVTIGANRAGISTNNLVEASPLVPNDSTAMGHHIGTRVIHAVLGGVVGVLTGAAIGAGVGAYVDSQSHGDPTIPATALLGFYGAVGGLALGAIIGAVWPVR